MAEIIPTCVPEDTTALAESTHVIRGFSKRIHVDIDDGAFVPALTWPYATRGEWAEFDLLPLGDLIPEVHLMVEEPRTLGLAFIRAGARTIIGHVESFADSTETRGAIDAWHAAGADVGLGVLFHTPLEVVEPLIPACNFLHLMTITTIGAQGIPYNPGAPERVAEFHARFPNTPISVDGGISEENITELVRAGAQRFCIGSAIMRAENPEAAHKRLVELAQDALQ